MKVIERVGRYSIFQRSGSYHLRWTIPGTKKQTSERVAENLTDARRAAHKRMVKYATPDELANGSDDPTFAAIWVIYLREKKGLSAGRQRRLQEFSRLYFASTLANVRVSRIQPAIQQLRDRLLDGWLGDNRSTLRGARTTPLSPNTIEDIIRYASAAVNEVASSGLFPDMRSITVLKVPGRTAPINRAPKGRLLSFEEMGRLIDACRLPHQRALMLLMLGSAARVGVFVDMRREQIIWKGMALNCHPNDTPQTRKRDPVVPVTGPMKWVISELCSEGEVSSHLIQYAGRPITGGGATQMMLRLAKSALPDAYEYVNWYSLRHTLINFLSQRVNGFNLSFMAGHTDSFTPSHLRQLQAADTTSIYISRSLTPLDEIRTVMETSWWPELQKHCSVDLRLNDPNVLEGWGG